jgi:hypothetical protein
MDSIVPLPLAEHEGGSTTPPRRVGRLRTWRALETPPIRLVERTWLVLVGLAAAGPLQAVLCTVPGTYPTIAGAVAAAECTEVSVQAGTFSEELTIQRSLSLHGIGAGSTILEGRLEVEGSGVVVALGDLTLDPVGCFEAGVMVSGGAQVQLPSGPVDVTGGGVGCLIFEDGFESGNTAEWSQSVPSAAEASTSTYIPVSESVGGGFGPIVSAAGGDDRTKP